MKGDGEVLWIGCQASRLADSVTLSAYQTMLPVT